MADAVFDQCLVVRDHLGRDDLAARLLGEVREQRAGCVVCLIARGGRRDRQDRGAHGRNGNR
jgi:hypothetical protein